MMMIRRGERCIGVYTDWTKGHEVNGSFFFVFFLFFSLFLFFFLLKGKEKKGLVALIPFMTCILISILSLAGSRMSR